MRASTSRVWEERARDRAISAVLPLLEAEGYDRIQLVDVADKARMSLATIYKYFPSRDELLVAAVERWMDENAYQFPPLRDEPVFEALMRVYRKIFRPWEEHPRMLEAFVRARTTAYGSRLIARGEAAVAPVLSAILSGLDPAFAEDLGMIITHVNYSVYTHVAAGQMKISEILPTFERTLYRILNPEINENFKARSRSSLVR
jgi:TetR/AcrR family transcriptional regulator, cholesterol catabolism regulator